MSRMSGENDMRFERADTRCQDFARPIELSREARDVLTTPLLPGLELRVSDVFGATNDGA